MIHNLDVLMNEIEKHLAEKGLAVFYGYSRALEPIPTVYWDADARPDYIQFIKAATAVDARMIVVNQRVFSSEQVDDAIEQLTGCDLPREEYRDFQRQFDDLRDNAGLVGEIELSFDHAGRTYLFNLRTKWFDEFNELMDEIQVISTEEDHDDPTLGGYFSKN